MKTRFLTIIAFVGVLLFSQNSDALILIDDPANTMDVIVVGTVVSVFPNYDKLKTEYEINIEEIVKGESLLNHGNFTKTLHFTSPGIDDSDIELRRTMDYKLFEEGQRALFLLYEKNDVLVHGLSVVNSFCTAEQMMQLYYVPAAGLVMTQDGVDEQPYRTHESITAQFYYFNKNLVESTIDVKIKIVDDFPDVLREETSTLNLDACQAYAMAEIQFTIEKPGKFAISVDVDGGNGGGMSISGIDVIDYFQSPLKQFKSGMPFHEIKCSTGLQLTQKYDDSPACVTSETYYELIKRNWVSNIILAIQSRDVTKNVDAMTSSYMSKVIPTLDDFRQALSESDDINEIFFKFGQPHDDIGSGIHIYEYVLNDSTKVWIGYTDHIWYVYHVDSHDNILEYLFLENEN